MKKAQKGFRKIKRILNNDNNMEYIGGYYFPSKAIKLLSEKDRDYFINSYYNLTIENILTAVRDFENLDQVKADYLNDYEKSAALAWYDNLCYVLAQL